MQCQKSRKIANINIKLSLSVTICNNRVTAYTVSHFNNCITHILIGREQRVKRNTLKAFSKFRYSGVE